MPKPYPFLRLHGTELIWSTVFQLANHEVEFRGGEGLPIPVEDSYESTHTSTLSGKGSFKRL